MKIAIIGTRGIPNNYGGFEQFAEYLSVGLVNKGHKVVVYSPHFHPFQDKNFKGVEIRHIFSPENRIGSMANFVYDWLSLKDAMKDNFDIIYEAGYQSSAISISWYNRKGLPLILTNMDGIEWKRSKWSKPIKYLTKRFEKMAIRKSDFLISDNIGIQNYYKKEHNTDSFFIAYGADVVHRFDTNYISEYNVKANEYYILIARLEPENNIETVLDGYILSQTNFPFVVVGNHQTDYGEALKNKYAKENICFIGGIYDKEVLDSLRYYSLAYLHGHSVGGTNPSLLEAMASKSFIVAHDNAFNRSVLKDNALYFNTEKDLCKVYDKIQVGNISRNVFIKNNLDQLEKQYSWDKIINDHESLFLKLIEDENNNFNAI